MLYLEILLGICNDLFQMLMSKWYIPDPLWLFALVPTWSQHLIPTVGFNFVFRGRKGLFLS